MLNSNNWAILFIWWLKFVKTIFRNLFHYHGRNFNGLATLTTFSFDIFREFSFGFLIRRCKLSAFDAALVLSHLFDIRLSGPRTCWRPACCCSWTAPRPSARTSADRCSATDEGNELIDPTCMNKKLQFWDQILRSKLIVTMQNTYACSSSHMLFFQF